MMSEHTPQQVLHDPATAIPADDVAAVHAYAGAFCGRPATAADLAAAVLSEQRGPAARPALLAEVRRMAFGWLRDSRSGLLRPGFRDWAQRAGESFGTTDTLRRAEHHTLLLRAFGELADQSRTALWLCLAEGETAFAARVLNTSEEFAASMAESARSRLADTFLRLRAEHTSDARCVHYGGMLGAIARGTHRETPADLEQHLETCEFCTHDMALLRTLTSGGPRELRPLLIDQLLVWGGPEYRTARQAAPRTSGRAPAHADKPARTRPGPWAKAALRVRGGRGARTAPEAGFTSTTGPTPETDAQPSEHPPSTTKPSTRAETTAAPDSGSPKRPTHSAQAPSPLSPGAEDFGSAEWPTHSDPGSSPLVHTAEEFGSPKRPTHSTPAPSPLSHAPDDPGEAPAPAPAPFDSPVHLSTPGAPAPPGTAPARPRPADPAPGRPVLAIAVAVVVTAVATTVALTLLSDTGNGRAVDSYGPPPGGPSQAPSASASAAGGPGTVLATVALKSAAEPGSCVGAAAGDSPDNIPAPTTCASGATQQWRVVDLGSGAVNLQHVASTFCLDIAGYRAVGDPMQLRPCAYTQGDSAPYPEDQAFLLKKHQDKTFTLVCQDNTGIAVGIRNGELRMMSAGTGAAGIRYVLDNALDKALGN